MTILVRTSISAFWWKYNKRNFNCFVIDLKIMFLFIRLSKFMQCNYNLWWYSVLIIDCWILCYWTKWDAVKLLTFLWQRSLYLWQPTWPDSLITHFVFHCCSIVLCVKHVRNPSSAWQCPGGFPWQNRKDHGILRYWTENWLAFL